jgi:hypothetical protein
MKNINIIILNYYFLPVFPFIQLSLFLTHMCIHIFFFLSFFFFFAIILSDPTQWHRAIKILHFNSIYNILICSEHTLLPISCQTTHFELLFLSLSHSLFTLCALLFIAQKSGHESIRSRKSIFSRSTSLLVLQSGFKCPLANIYVCICEREHRF